MNRVDFVLRWSGLYNPTMSSDLDALIEAEKAEAVGPLVYLLIFAVTNAHRFTEHDPDGVKAGWITAAKTALEGVTK